MAQYADDFSAYAVDTVANSGNVDAIANWTFIGPLDVWRVWTIKADAASPGGQYLEAQDTGGGNAVAFLQFDTPGTLPADTALEWLFEFELTALVQNFIAKLIYNAGDYYSFEITAAGGMRLWHVSGLSPFPAVGSGDATPDRATGTPAALIVGKKYRVRCVRTAGNAWSWKCWAPSDGAEPAGWNVGDGGAGGVVSSDTPGGATGIGYYQTGSTTKFGYFAVATAGDSAPEPGGSAPSISNVDGDDTVFEGQTSVQVNGANFGATQGTGSVKVSPTDDINDVNAVTPTVGTWGDTQITLSSVSFPTGVAEGGTAYVFVTADGGSSNASGHAITRLDITAPLLSSGTATGVTPTAATPQVTTNEAAGQAWYVIVPSAEGTPSGTRIKAGQNAAGGAPVASGTVNPVSGTTVTFAEVTGLSPSTSYKICFYQEDAATPTPNGSNVTTHTFSTLPLPAINTSASFAEGIKQVGNGQLLPDESNIRVDVWRNDTGAQVLFNQTIAAIASGHLSFEHASLPAVSLHIKAYPASIALPFAWDQTPA